jgi:hypothetical protein
MKLTLKDFFSNAQATIHRFPLAIAIAWAGAVLSIYAVHSDFEIVNQVMPYVFTLLFALPLAVAADIFSESHSFDDNRKFGMRVVVVLLGVFAYIGFYQGLSDLTSESDAIRAFVYQGMALLAFVLAPVLQKSHPNRFWQYFWLVLVRLFLAVAYFALLVGGLALLMGAVDYLLGVNIEPEYYADLWIFMVGAVSIIFFLQGIPENTAKLERVTKYSKVLKAIVEYVSVPLVYAYFLVLYLYTGKIVFTWQWPEGDVAWWIIFFSVVGVASYFFSYAVKEKFHSYVDFFRKWFFVALIPQLLVLYIALLLRVGDYGWTELRYFLGAFGDWLFIMALYYVISTKRYLKFIPISLLAILALSMWGPWSAFNISLDSQMARLQAGLYENGMWVEGELVPAQEGQLSDDVDADLSSIVEYIVGNHGVEHFQPLFEENLVALAADAEDRWELENQILGMFGLTGMHYFGHYGGSVYYDASCSYACVVDVDGFDRYVPISLYGNGKGNSLYELAGENDLWFEGLNLMISNDGGEAVAVDFSALVDAAVVKGTLDESLNTVTFELEEYGAELRVTGLELSEDMSELFSVQGHLLVGLK